MAEVANMETEAMENVEVLLIIEALGIVEVLATVEVLGIAEALDMDIHLRHMGHRIQDVGIVKQRLTW